MPVLQIYGNSMTPTLQDGEIVFSLKTGEMKPGDIVAFYYNNKILVKRVIACPGDWVDIDENGTVYVNDLPLEEPYLSEKAHGEPDIELPYQVPDGRFFVLGDHRATSVDSRHTAVGCVAEEQVVGKIVFRAWPLEQLGGLLKSFRYSNAFFHRCKNQIIFGQHGSASACIQMEEDPIIIIIRVGRKKNGK